MTCFKSGLSTAVGQWRPSDYKLVSEMCQNEIVDTNLKVSEINPLFRD